MSTKLTRFRLALTMIVLSIITVAVESCDPEQMVSQYFKQLGINRLAIVRDDIRPGAVILVRGKDAIYDDNLLEYVNGASDAEADAAITSLNAISNYNAVIGQYTADRSMDISVALQFIKTVLPISPTANLDMSGNVTIDLINAQVERMSPASINKFLKSKANTDFVSHLQSLGPSVKPNIAYEILTSSKLKITAKSSANIGASIKADQIYPLSSGSASFTYKRSGDHEIEIDGDHYYVFAIRTGRIIVSNGVYVLDDTQFKLPGAWGVKAAGTDMTFSAPLVGDYELVRIKNKFEQ